MVFARSVALTFVLSPPARCQLMFMFVELVVGWWTNSLGLISDAGHMFFDNASLFIGLYASYMAKWRKDDVFTYGYGRSMWIVAVAVAVSAGSEGDVVLPLLAVTVDTKSWLGL